MAGLSGAGKTEFIKLLRIKRDNDFIKLLHIDADLIRTEFLKDFYYSADKGKSKKGNVQLLQKASTKGIEILIGYCFKRKNIVYS